MEIREIASSLNSLIEPVHNILDEKLDKRKLSARWMLRLLTVEQKRNRVTTLEHGIVMFKHNQKEFLRCDVTVYENSELQPADQLQKRQRRFH